MQNTPRDERWLQRALAELGRRLRTLETTPLTTTSSDLAVSGDLDVSGEMAVTGSVHSAWNQASTITADSTAIVAGASLDIATVTVTIPAVTNTATKVTATWNGVLSSGTTTDTLYNMRIFRDATQIAGVRIVGTPHNQTDGGRSLVIVDPAPTAGSHTYKFNISHEAASTATDITNKATATTPTQLIVEAF